MSASRRGARLTAALALLLALAGCAPRLAGPPVPPIETLEARHRAALTQRIRRLTALDSELYVWAEGRALGRMPGVAARLMLAAPDRVRLRLTYLFGTALDVAASGDSLTAVVPPRRLAMVLDHAADSLGIPAPASLVSRAFGAAWDPPADAWRTATQDSALTVVRWAEHADSLRLAVDRDGLPVELRLARAGMSPVLVQYLSWSREGGIAWPERFRLADLDGAFHVDARVERVRFAARPEPGWFAIRMPARVELVEWSAIRLAVERIGELP